MTNKPEPLKHKRWFVGEEKPLLAYSDGDEPVPYHYREEDVRAAVLWLLRELEEQLNSPQVQHEEPGCGAELEKAIEKIKDAFPDVLGENTKTTLLARTTVFPPIKKEDAEITIKIKKRDALEGDDV